ncbi:MAG: LUD domain-containing protein [Bacteroidota bacterium]
MNTENQLHQVKAQYNAAFSQACEQFSNLELAKSRAAHARWKSIENLDSYLIEFEANFIKRGGKIIWAQDSIEAIDAILDISKNASARNIIKSKSSTAEEILLKERAGVEGFNIIETDAGDYIADSMNDHSGHMILPAIHKSVPEINTHFGLNDLSPEQLIGVIRDRLRSLYVNADIGITGCNFLIADPGAIVITENEGNAQLCASAPKTHIVLAGIDKILPSLNYLDLFLPLLSTYGTGQKLTAYNSIIMGPKQAEDLDGPEELYVVIIDNGRSNVLGYEVQRQASTCIKCGACQFNWPVYMTTTDHTFSDPVSVATAPLKDNFESQEDAVRNSLLDGSMMDNCPVKIDIQKLLIENRKLSVEKGFESRSNKLFYFFWKKAMLNRDIMNWKGIKAGKYIMEGLYKSDHGLRDTPSIAPQSFNEHWREKLNIK